MSQFISDDSVNTNLSFKEILRRVWPYARRHMFMLFFITVSIFGLTVMSRLMPTLIGYAIDKGIRAHQREVLIQAAFGYLILQFAYTLSEFAFSYLFQKFGNRMLYYLREDVLSHVQKLPVQYFNKTPVGRIVTRITNDIANLGELFSESLVNVISQSFIMLSIFIAMALISVKLTLYTTLLAPLFIWLSYRISEHIRKVLRESKKRLAALNSYVSENISGMKVVQLYNRVDRNLIHFSKLSKSYTEGLLSSIRSYASMQPVLNLFNAVTISAALYFGGLMSSENSIALGSLVAFLMHAQDLIPPIREVIEKYQQLQNCLTSAERVFQLLDEPIESGYEIQTAPVTKPNQGSIELRHLSFRYAQELPLVLDDISLTIPAGRSLAIVGRTGSGKTTIISLLQRFYEAPKNSIFIDGLPIEKLGLRELRTQIGVVQQENFLFRGTIRENISLLDPRISEDMIVSACEHVGYFELLKKTGRNLESQVEERGANLSTGERQLIAFARILAFKPQVLILDEATSNVDSATEKIIQRATDVVTKGRTSIIIAHRLSTIENCDQIAVLEKGRVVELGTHNELMNRKGAYYQVGESGEKSISTLDSTDGTASP